MKKAFGTKQKTNSASNEKQAEMRGQNNEKLMNKREQKGLVERKTDRCGENE